MRLVTYNSKTKSFSSIIEGPYSVIRSGGTIFDQKWLNIKYNHKLYAMVWDGLSKEDAEDKADKLNKTLDNYEKTQLGVRYYRVKSSDLKKINNLN